MEHKEYEDMIFAAAERQLRETGRAIREAEKRLKKPMSDFRAWLICTIALLLIMGAGYLYVVHI